MMVRKIGKIVLAAAIAFAVLTVFCFFYYNAPVHFDCDDGSTDYVWESNKFRSDFTEGFSFGKTNNEGYSNAYDYEAGKPIKVLIMGSSQMEAFNVRNNQSTAYLLNAKIDGNVYNIAVSDHFFLTCVKNLSDAVEKYNPEYVVIEPYSINVDDEDIQRVLEGNYPNRESHSGGFLGIIQKNQFLRCAYTQMKLSLTEGTESPAVDIEEKKESALMTDLFEKIDRDRGRSKVIILYQPNLFSDEDTERFENLCGEFGFIFLDMRPRFQKEYKEKNICPHGFLNTSIETGHLNKHGHEMIAEELYRVIGEAG